MTRIIQDWQGLSEMDKVASVVTDVTKNEAAKDFLNAEEKIEEVMVNNMIRFEKLDRMVKNPDERSVSNLLYANKSVSTRIYRNIAEKRDGYWHFKNGELVKMHDYNWATLVEKLGNNRKVDEFANYLVARDQHFEWERLDEMKDQVAELEKQSPFGDPELDTLKQKAKDLEDYLKRNEDILPRNTVDKVYDDYSKYFSEEEAMFDSMVNNDLNFLLDVGEVSKEKYAEYTERKGYAPMRRLVEDGIL